jgi:hypothetical protein
MVIRLMLLVALLLPLSALATERQQRGPDTSIGNDAQQPSRAGERDRLVREIRQDVGRDDLRQDATRGGFDKPRVINSERELEQVFTNQTVQDQLNRAVNFNQQKLLLFAWSGSGGDRLDHKVEGQEVVFQFKPGVTKDLRAHVELFALAKDTPYQVEKAEISGRDKEEDQLDRARRSDRSDEPRTEQRPGESRKY